MSYKYRLGEKEGNLFRIIAIKSFNDVKKGDIGGLICSTSNLSQLGNCWIYGNGKVYENGIVYGNGKVSGDGKVYENGIVSGDGKVYGNGKVYGYGIISYYELNCDMLFDLKKLIACSLNIYPVFNKYIFYKRVFKIGEGVYSSCFDKNFIYKDNKIKKVKNFDPDKLISCSSGIHVSTPFYYKKGDTLIAVEVNINDVITCTAGKLRVKKVKVLGEINVS